MNPIERIQALYKALGFNRRSFADTIGIGYQTISTMEKRNSDPSFKMLHAIKVNFPNVSLNWIFLGEGEMFISDEPVKTPEYIDKLLASMEESNKALQDNSKLLREKVLLLEKELEQYDEELAKYKSNTK
jgi:DNA-binding XRE family transcriptional regulator